MKACAFYGKRDVRVVDIPVPKVPSNGVLIHVKACGICGTDMHVYNSALLVEASTKKIGGHLIIGHEFTGEIVEIGPDADGFKPGDRVCSVHNKGGLAEYAAVEGDRLENLFSIPDHLPYKTAATLEPLCNPVHSFHMREPGDDETVALFGSGVIGLGYLQALRAYSRARVIVVDISDFKLDVARKIGASETINAKNTDAVKKIKEITGEHTVRYQPSTAGGCDVAVDCAGIPLTLRQCLEVLKPENGTAIVAAIYEDEIPIDANMVVFKYMSVLGSMGYYPEETEEALRLIADGRVNRDILVTHTLPLKDAARGFEVQKDPEKSIKVVIVNE
ncbi:MAG: zinc-binding dehydrogenase [Spirochaetes bacterium]|nr:zinc-binding dehydrogenase [Spirochaetota bacterium]